MSCDVNKALKSKPSESASYPNYVASQQIIQSEGSAETTCQDLLGKSLGSFAIENGKYNFNLINSVNITEASQITEQVKDYSDPCPKGWTNNNGCIAPESYNKVNNSCLTGRYLKCPSGSVVDPNDCRICSFKNSPVTDSQTRINSCIERNGTYNTFDEKCYLRIEGKKRFTNDSSKIDFENTCQVEWPKRNNTIYNPRIVRCNPTNSNSLGDEIGKKVIKLSGNISANNESELRNLAARRIMSSGYNTNYFALAKVGNTNSYEIFIPMDKDDVSAFTSKMQWTPDTAQCIGNREVLLYSFSNDLNKKACECENINNVSNDTNMGSNTTISGTNTITEGFANYENQSDVFKRIRRLNEMQNPNWPNNYKSNTYRNANEVIQKNLNQIMKNLSKNYNKTASVYNKQTDIINQHQNMVESNAQKLNKQLEDLDKIRDEITLRTRLIELNEEMAEKKDRNKKMMMGFFVILPILLIPVLMMSFNMMSQQIGMILLITIIIAYGVYLFIIYRRSAPKDFKPILVGEQDPRKTAVQQFYEDQKNKLKKEMNDYVNKECACPEEEDDLGPGSKEEKEERRIDKLLAKFLTLVPSTTSLANYQEMFNIIGCKRSLEDKDINFWKKLPTMSQVIGDMKAYQRLAKSCTGTTSQNDFCLPGYCSKYKMSTNGPYIYYDGSEAPQQIYPDPVGKIKVNIDGQDYTAPDDVFKALVSSPQYANIQNMIKKMFFVLWSLQLLGRGVSFSGGQIVFDDKFKNYLEIGEKEIGATPEPNWQGIGLPLVENIDNTIKKVCYSYNEERKEMGNPMGIFLTDMWKFIYGEEIPKSIYISWLSKFNNAVAADDDLNDYYEAFVKEVVGSDKFKKRYGGLNNFIDVKVKEMLKTINSNYKFHEPSVTRLQ